ncbi:MULTISPECIES: GIY-YIG nuclease family protein [unclassified Streptomyces]|uniref:GIY-YIG nuclease family protein n=1 Tax=unclassified Streptomyces TaxID=2593676 RepID=UPI000DB9E381|nr:MULTISPECIES: GIY-YIG nuclease family protein [unclassified Streptomyces]MYT71363.1 GIY-YIG nuclease family protein [Streptomyces sp. SID8367]RAJ82820.1 GIY-YIG catalytic domain-containing protein [Streptomyces sp. PsTaAH-137]
MPLENHAEFKLSITKALGDQLAAALETLTPAPLTEENIARLPRHKGVYQLFRHGEPVYIGKADATLGQRLRKHLKKLSGRENIHLEWMTFMALSVDEDFAAVAPEKLLIDSFQSDGRAPWNENGFGINDPGVERDTTVFSDDHFDQLYPANLDWVIGDLPQGTQTLRSFLKFAKTALPYTFRYAYYRTKRESFYEQFEVTIEQPEMTANDFLRFASSQLPESWQIMVLPGYAVMYPREMHSQSARRHYIAGLELAPNLDLHP